MESTLPFLTGSQGKANIIRSFTTKFFHHPISSISNSPAGRPPSEPTFSTKAPSSIRSGSGDIRRRRQQGSVIFFCGLVLLLVFIVSSCGGGGLEGSNEKGSKVGGERGAAEERRARGSGRKGGGEMEKRGERGFGGGGEEDKGRGIPSAAAVVESTKPAMRRFQKKGLWG